MKKLVKTGLYIHVPFCIKRCDYCDFFSSVYDEKVVSKYVDELCAELTLLGRKYEKTVTLDTLYFGGGTPSLINPSKLEKIIYTVASNFKCEIEEATIEVNPDSASHLKDFKSMGINRVSVGVQSLNENLLNKIGRHTGGKEESLRTLENAANIFDNVSCDIMTGIDADYGFNDEIQTVLPYVNHISAYMLKIENGTALKKRVETGATEFPDDDKTADSYSLFQNILESNGLYRYEVSNFARLGSESKHNMKYWTMQNYLGVGASAHSYFDGRRYFNADSIEKYISGEHSGHGKEIVEREYSITADMEETLMLGLRTADGIDVKDYNRKFNVDLMKIINRPECKFLQEFFVISRGRLRVPTKHFNVLNGVLAEILP